jgi:hypothetical protein
MNAGRADDPRTINNRGEGYLYLYLWGVFTHTA